MKLSELLKPFDVNVTQDCHVTGLQNDSRQVQLGNLFIAYPGQEVDGRRYIKQAIDKGASAVLYEPEALDCALLSGIAVPCLPLHQVNQKLAAIASLFYGNPSQDLFITGITGTNGKTTIAHLLAQAHDQLSKPAAYIGTLGEGRVDFLTPLNNTTPDGLCLQKLFANYKKKGIQQVSMEVSSHALSLNRVDNVHFDQAVFTNLSHEHLDFHHTMEAYAAAKAQLFARPSIKTAILNVDDAYADRMVSNINKACQKITYGIEKPCDVRALNLNLGMNGSAFEILSPWGKDNVSTNLLGAFNVYNTLAVYSCLMAEGFSKEDVIGVLGQLKPVPGRMEVVSKVPCVIVDYAHSPDALEQVLKTAVQLKQGRLITVFGCGGERDHEKRPLMGQVAGMYSDQVIITSDNPRREEPEQIIDEIAAGVDAQVDLTKITQRAEAIAHAIHVAKENDLILIAGKGHESYQQIGLEYVDFSDQKVVQQALS